MPEPVLNWLPLGDGLIPVPRPLAGQYLRAVATDGGRFVIRECHMSLELRDSILRLILSLRKGFEGHGPRSKGQRWSYQLRELNRVEDAGPALTDGEADARFAECRKPEVCTFAAFLRDPPHYMVTEAIAGIPFLGEVAANFTGARRLVDAEREHLGAAECSVLFDMLCEREWFTDPSYSISRKKVSWVCILAVVPSDTLLRLLESAQATISYNITTALALDAVQKEVVELLRSVGHRMSTEEILTEFNNRGTPKAESTLKGKLASAVQKGAITTNRTVNPPGYGLPEWDG